MLKGPVEDGKGQCITLVSIISLLSLTIVVGHALMLIILWKDPFKRFRTPPTFLVCGMVLANFASCRVRTHEKNSGDAVCRLGAIIQSIFCAQSGTSILLTVWKWSGESVPRGSSAHA